MAPDSERVALAGRWVVVTGASGGLGEVIARQLVVERGARVVLVARRAERLAALAGELRAAGGEAVVLPLDLAAPDAVDRLVAEATRGRVVHGLVLNAASYHYGDFTAMPEAMVDEMLTVNAMVPVRLVRRFLPIFDAQGGGGVLMVASTGGLMPAPRQAVYAASKALVCNFAQSLYYERGPDAIVPVTLCCPGGMPTAMLQDSPVMAQVARRRWMRVMLTAPERVAREALDAWVAGAALCIPGRLNRVMDRVTRLLPRGVAGRGAARVYPG